MTGGIIGQTILGRSKSSERPSVRRHPDSLPASSNEACPFLNGLLGRIERLLGAYFIISLLSCHTVALMEKVTLDWPQLKKNSNPASVIFAQDFLVTRYKRRAQSRSAPPLSSVFVSFTPTPYRDERANAFAVIKLSGGESAKAKEQLVFDALKTPIACWTLHEGSDTLFVAHTDFSLQVTRLFAYHIEF